MRAYLIILTLIISQVSFSQDTLTITVKKPEFPEGSTVSMISLIATPEKYDGKRVQLVGFLNVEYESYVVYLHQEDYEKSILKNGIRLSLDAENFLEINKEDLNKSYVVIAGTFEMNKKNQNDLWSGFLKEIYRIDKWK